MSVAKSFSTILLFAATGCGGGDGYSPVPEPGSQQVAFNSEPVVEDPQDARFGSQSTTGANCAAECGDCELCDLVCQYCPTAGSCVGNGNDNGCEDRTFGCVVEHCPSLVQTSVEVDEAQ
jgi:hypothetical protein